MPPLGFPALYKASMQIFSPNAQPCEVSIPFPTWLMKLRTPKSQVSCSVTQLLCGKAWLPTQVKSSLRGTPLTRLTQI